MCNSLSNQEQKEREKVKICVFAVAIMGLGYAVFPDNVEATVMGRPKCSTRDDVSVAALNAANLAIAYSNFRGISARDRNRTWGTLGMLMGLTTWVILDGNTDLNVFRLRDNCSVLLDQGLFLSGTVSFVLGFLRISAPDKPDRDVKPTRQWRTSPIVFLSRSNKYLGVALVVEL